MEQSFEQDIPIWAIITCFLVLTLVSQLIRIKLRARKLIKEGQLPTSDGRVATIEERLAGNKIWSSGEISSKGRSFMLVLWLVAVVLNLTLGVSFIKSFSNPNIHTAARVMLGLFSLIGVGFTAFAVRETIRFFRFGESKCIIHGKVGVIGQSISGLIRTNSDLAVTGDYVIELCCTEIYYIGSGDNRRSQTITHFKTEQNIPFEGKSSQIGIPFLLSIPTYPPETGYQLARGDINWQISLRAPVGGVDYAAQFVVPVFKLG